MSFPTEIISLPSRGLLYPEDHPLATGEIELKYMTAREEDILSSANLIRKGVVLDKLLESVIVTRFNLRDLLLVDKEAVLLSTRMFGYGKMYKATITCPSCGTESPVEIDLSEMNIVDVDFDEWPDHKNEFPFVLPRTGKTITWKLMTHGDSVDVTEEERANEKFDRGGVTKSVTSRLRRVITSVEGDTSPSVIKDFVENQLIALDSRALREEIKKRSPSVEIKTMFVCPGNSCDFRQEVEAPLGANLFWPDAEG